jgi:hypothetical protein
VKVGIDEFMEAQKVMAQTNAVLKSTGGAAKVTATQITDLSSSIMKMTGIDDEAIQAGQNLLLTFTKIRNETGKGNDIFDQATLAMTNLSVAMGKDLSSSAILVGKALNDPVKGVSALSRAGVQFTEGQKETIKSLIESGDAMTAQKMILKELETQFGGSAEAAGKTLPGQLNILKQTFSNLAGQLVTTFMPAIARAATRLVGFLLEFGKQPTLTAKISFVIGAFQNAAWAGVRSITNWWNTTKVSFEDNPANRLKVTIAPSGRDQVNAFAADLKVKLDKSVSQIGNSVGRSLARGIFGGASKESASLANPFGNEFIRNLFVSMPAIDLGRDIATAIFNGISEVFSQRANDNPIVTFLRGIGFVISPALSTAIAAVRKSRPAFVKAFSVIISDPIKDAISSARASLAGLGTNLGELLSTITGKTSPEAKAAADIRKQQKLDAAAREKKSLEDAVATAETDDERRRAQQDLDDYLLDQEAQRLEQVVADRQAADSLSIDNLIDQFNRGLIGAGEFSSQLDGIIGANRGAELGGAFASAFSASLTALTTEIAGIVAGVAGVQAPAGSIVAGGQSQAQEEKNARYQEQLAAWNERRKARLERAEEARRASGSAGGKKITAAERAEITKIMADWDAQPGNKKPTPMARGGILKQPTFVAGEAGREAVIPLESSSAMKILRDAIGGGGGSTVVYNLVVNAGLGTDPDDLGRVIVESIKRFEKRNGQAFSAPLLSVTQNVAGQTATGSAKTDFNRVTTLRKG